MSTCCMEKEMIENVIVGILGLALIVYLFFVLMRPENF